LEEEPHAEGGLESRQVLALLVGYEFALTVVGGEKIEPHDGGLLEEALVGRRSHVLSPEPHVELDVSLVDVVVLDVVVLG